MDKNEHLLTIVSEECAEVSQRATKALRFGINEIQEGQTLTNAQRLQYEFSDLLGAYELLEEEGLVKWPKRSQILSKKIKVIKFLALSEKQGTLT